MRLVSRFPAAWLCTVTVRRPQGHDPKGNPLPEETHTVTNCLIGWRGTDDPLDRSDLVSNTAIIYTDPGADFRAGDRIDIPAGPWPHGDDWWVDGDVKPWPMGTETPIRKGT